VAISGLETIDKQSKLQAKGKTKRKNSNNNDDNKEKKIKQTR